MVTNISMVTEVFPWLLNFPWLPLCFHSYIHISMVTDMFPRLPMCVHVTDMFLCTYLSILFQIFDMNGKMTSCYASLLKTTCAAVLILCNTIFANVMS